ncbi:MAG: epoxyqueuosine reductase [Lachnospiraceae bacterium]|nr:epoxyqueuosine reductase [Lachnospiraceae bacterium]
MLEQKIREIFSRYPEVIYGFADISYSPHAESYRSALVFAVPYGEQLAPEDYTEERFDRGIISARDVLEVIVSEIEGVLQESGTAYWVPPVAQKNETELLAPFSFKSAAAHAGLGWYGKNDVIITERYGPRVRLSAILIDEVFTYGETITESRCPEDCRKCVDICPVKAIKNCLWTLTTDRSEMIDYQKCNKMRSAFIKKLGRKNACGLCLAVCPIGRLEEGAARESGTEAGDTEY